MKRVLRIVTLELLASTCRVAGVPLDSLFSFHTHGKRSVGRLVIGRGPIAVGSSAGESDTIVDSSDARRYDGRERDVLTSRLSRRCRRRRGRRHRR